MSNKYFLTNSIYHILDRSRSAILMLSVGLAVFILIPIQTRERDDAVPLGDYSISAGSIAYVSGGGRSIGVGANRETLTALVQAVAARDREAYEHLFKNGQAFLVDDRVRVRIVSLEGITAEVQFLEGYHSQTSGFVSREWLRSER